MAIDLQIKGRALIINILEAFNIIPELFTKERFPAIKKIINSITKEILKLTKIDEDLITKISYDLNALRDIETLKEEDFEVYFQIISDDLNSLKDKMFEEYGEGVKIVKYSIEKTYGRIMTDKEYKELIRTKILISYEKGQMVPTFEAPPKVLNFFKNKTTKDKIHNLFQALGGSGNAQWVVFFTTKIKPLKSMSCRHMPQIKEAKFPDGIIVKIIDTRRI